ncbi:MAG: bifunctional demethylmenaquinone methyltransferase/2-methoxy-6-polyprenyl-1,4-benzoquinol methylase UbiE [Acidobacteriota bacterium]
MTRPYSGPDANRIRSMFASIAGGYDRANTLLSGGIHHLWRRRLVDWSGANPGNEILDCATGTGDLALAFAELAGQQGRVVGTDFCAEMLAFAPGKAKKRALQIDFEVADVTALPYADESFDIASIAFGIRNVNDPFLALQELARVVRPGGRVMVLEFGQPERPVVGPLFRFYSHRVLPRLGGMITGNPEAYGYLDSSAAAFPSGEAFLELMRETGLFRSVESRPLTFGVAYIYRGVVEG